MSENKGRNRQSREREVVRNLIEAMEKNEAPWQKPWEGCPPRQQINAVTGKPYNGLNQLMLSMKFSRDPRWCTFNQAKKQGWQVKKGAKGYPIEFYSIAEKEKENQETGEMERSTYPVLRRYHVFHASDIEGIPECEHEAEGPERHEWERESEAEAILEASGADIDISERDRAYYSPLSDQICLPERNQFREPAYFYEVALHELGHWTGHSSRLNRKFGSFGDETYALEELRAEIASYFLAVELELPISQEHIDNHAAYTKSWLRHVKKDKKALIHAVRDAQAISRFVMGMSPVRSEVDENVNGKNEMSNRDDVDWDLYDR